MPVIAWFRSHLPLLVVIVAIASLATCRYGHQPFATPPTNQSPFTLLTVEVDDYGAFWDATAAQNALDIIDSESERRNTIVLLYIHGWHHNARPDDSNLAGFQTTLHELTSTLALPPYQLSRQKLTGKPDVGVIGIYVGWRGRSLPGFLDYSTLWPRKTVAERVGRGDLQEFVTRLQKIYELRNRPGVRPFMGLVTTGHSLGGQVLFNALSGALEREMIAASRRFSVTTSDAHLDVIPVPTPLHGIGDIAVLLNPAMEAYEFERIHQLNAQLSYSCVQTPALVVVSGEDDFARQNFFPLARWVSGLFEPGFRASQKELWRTALGEYEPQRTHQLEITSAPSTLVPENYSTPAQILSIDFSARIILGGAELKPLPGRHNPYDPVVVAYSSRKLIQGHNGIFTDTFRQFLTDYVAFIEGKRMLIRSLQISDTGCAGRQPTAHGQ